MSRRGVGSLIFTSTAMVGLALVGCAGYQRDEALVARTARGDFGSARFAAQGRLSDNPADRAYMLDRLKALILTLAEGVPEAAGVHADRVYEMLRTQGLNADNTVPSFFIGEGGARVWKGEPFEQAMGYCYVALYEASRGDFGNARAAANNSLFLLRDFSQALHGRAEAASERDAIAQREALVRAGQDTGQPDSIGVDYRAVASDFELGYALKAVCARALGDTAEAQEAAATLAQIAPHLSSLASRLAQANYNTVLVVDAGLGPAKVATGPDGAIALFRAVSPSDTAPLVVRAAGQEAGFPVVTDLNRLARDLKWNNLEDLRLAKSTIGNVLVAGGLVTAGLTANDDNPTAALIGLGVAGVGALLKGTAAADTRHCEVLPQRVYVVLLNLPVGGGDGASGSSVELSLGSSRLVLPNVPAGGGAGSASGAMTLRYVRLPLDAGAWSTRGQVLYTADTTAPARTPTLPYILGGRDVRTPAPTVMEDYYAAGLPRTITSADLLSMFREEEIQMVALNPAGGFGRHVLEGGSGLYSPQAGTTGFVRLFCQEHPAYAPRSPRVRALGESLSRR